MSEDLVHPDSTASRPRLEDRLVDEARFIKTWIDNPVLTGAVSPSGRFLARMMARAVDPDGTGPVIELGPGTGPITQALLKRGVDPGRLVLVEYDGAFCRLLRKRFPAATVVQGDAYDLRRSLRGNLPVPADAVVSSLPLLNKPDAQRLKLLEDAFALMAPGGSFVQFTYGANSPIPRSQGLDFQADVSPPVWFNLPPARVWIYRCRKVEHVLGVVPRDPQAPGPDGPGSGMFRPVAFRPGKPRGDGLFRRRRDRRTASVRD